MNEKNKNKKQRCSVSASGLFFIVTLFISFFFAAPPVVFAEALSLADGNSETSVQASLSAEAFDTVNGIEGLVKIKGGEPHAKIEVIVTDPMNMQNILFATLDSQGIKNIPIPPSVTQRSGGYTVKARSGPMQTVTSFVVFGENSIEIPSDIGGDSNRIAVIDLVDHFEIENLPSSVSVGERTSFTIKAVDASGEIVPTYAGVVHFSSTDRNAQVPGDYGFVAQDQGRRTFDLALTLRTAGTQRVYANDTDDAAIRGEKIVEVMRGAYEAGTGELYITKPSPGTYSATTLSIEGNAVANVRIQIYDNDQQIGETTSNTTGRFSFKTPLLRDGVHRFHIESNSSASAPVEIHIDSTPARVENVQIGETTLAPGATTTISIVTDPDVSQIRAIIGDYITDLEQDSKNPTTYHGQLVAPQVTGEHPVSVIVSDRFGNGSETVEVGNIRVDAALQNEGSFSFNVPSTVTGVQAKGVLNGILLAWNEAQAEAGLAFYRIYYGTTPDDLKQIITTNSKEPSYLVTNLQSGTQYFFKVSAVDLRGNESDNLSTMISATASDTSPVGQIYTGPPQQGDVVLCDPSPCPMYTPPPYTPSDGPAIFLPLMGSIFAGFVSLRKKKR